MSNEQDEKIVQFIPGRNRAPKERLVNFSVSLPLRAAALIDETAVASQRSASAVIRSLVMQRLNLKET